MTVKEIVDGDTEVTVVDGKVKFDGKADADDEDIHMNRFEVGANFIAGYTFRNNLSVQANFNLGLTDVYPGETSKYKSRYFGVGVGYWFGGNK
jgi:hypothetical protein